MQNKFQFAAALVLAMLLSHTPNSEAQGGGDVGNGGYSEGIQFIEIAKKLEANTATDLKNAINEVHVVFMSRSEWHSKYHYTIDRDQKTIYVSEKYWHPWFNKGHRREETVLAAYLEWIKRGTTDESIREADQILDRLP